MASEATQSPVRAEDKLLGIEALRFLSALAVLVWHYQHLAFFGTAAAPWFEPVRQPFYALLEPFYRYGFYGVEVFWCISGFIFFWKYAAPLSRSTLSGGRFFVLRFSRLYPLHFVTLLLVAALQLLYFSRVGQYFIYPNNDWPHFIRQLFIASNWWSREESFNGPIWSVSEEVLVYAVFYFAMRYGRGPVRICAVLATIGLIVVGTKTSTHPFFYCLMCYFIGCLAAVVYARLGDAGERARAVAGAVIGAFVVMVVAFAAARGIRPMPIVLMLSPSLTLLCAMFVRGGPRSSQLLNMFGSMTYSSYLLHIPLQLITMLVMSMLGLSFPFYSPWAFLGYLGVVLVISYGCYVKFEMPAQALLRRRLKWA
jgi:peptidoglycan/LPS O-acetylase OafA/YrhL